MTFTSDQLKYLSLLSQQYPSIRDAGTEIINLTSILNLPKGTEHFLSDIHGEYEAFYHVLKNASGVIRRKIDLLFAGELSEDECRLLATLIYYPEKKLPLILKAVTKKDEWYKITILRLIRIARDITAKYSRSRVRKRLPEAYAYIIEELFNHQEENEDRHRFYRAIIDTIIESGQADGFIIAICELIHQLAIDKLHIIGDIFDRGAGSDRILELLMGYRHQDISIQWGNHDVLWMGAAAGHDACIANVVRIALRYLTQEVLEDGYAISMLPLATFAMQTYADDPCENFTPRPQKAAHQTISENETRLLAKMHKAITVIQLKLESRVIRRRPHYHMEDRLLLSALNPEKTAVSIDGVVYPLKDCSFPTVDPQNPEQLTTEERHVVEKLRAAFINSDRLQRHIRFLFSRGSMYLVSNNNLLYHGCIPLNSDGTFKTLTFDGKEYSGKAFMDRVEMLSRQGYFSHDDLQAKEYGMDAMWYLWSGADSPLYGKNKMTTFERYFIDDPVTHQEKKNPYYTYRNNDETCAHILAEFGLDPQTGHIINGHVPVKVRKGESPIKADGKLIVIDGGFSRAYQKETGIAGYTLIFNSHGLVLASHHPFESAEKAVEEELDIHSTTTILETAKGRLYIKDTDEGRKIERRITELRHLLAAYREGYIKERC